MPDKIESFKLVCRGGLNSNENHLELAEQSPGAATRLVNYEPSLFGGYRRIEGYDFYDPLFPEVGVGEAEGPVLCTAMFHNIGLGNPYLIAARKDIGTDTYTFWYHTPLIGWRKMTHPARPLVNGSFTVSKLRHVQFDFGAGGHIAFADGANKAIIFDGTTWQEIDPATQDQALPAPALIEVFENHLFMSGDDAFRSVVSHSAPNAPFDWTAASGGGQLTIGFPVVAIRPFRDNLFIFGSNGIKKALADVSAGFNIEQVTANVGCISRDSVVEIGGDLVFLAPDGLRPVAGTSRIGDVELETISKSIQGRLLDIIQREDLDTLNAVVVRSKSQVRFFVGDTSKDVPDSIGILGGLIDVDGQIGWSYGELIGIRASCASSEYIGREEFVLHGDYDGKVYRQEQGTSFAGNDILAYYSTPYLDFGDTEIRKVLHRVNIFLRAEGPFTLNMSVQYDWGDQFIPRPSDYTQSSSGAPTVYGGRSVTYGADGIIYGGTSKPVMISDIQGSGFAARLTFVTVGQDKPHSIQGCVIEFATSGRR